MTTSGFFTEAGPLQLGGVLGRGGEGEVFALADGSGRALKVYADPDSARKAKVRAMVAAGLAGRCPTVTFPHEVAYRADGAFAGFTMSLVDDGKLIHELYSPASRRQHFPDVDWRFLMRAAANMAQVFVQIHAAGAVVGDINGSGVLVTPRATIVIIDADSFQLGPEHPCRVGMPEYTPPELQGQKLGDIVRTVDHDGFGIAVLIFQLLFLGRHPFAGRSLGRDIPLAEAIRQGHFAYSLHRTVRLAPPPATLLLSDLPLGLRTLFERAFGKGLGPRPSPTEWLDELRYMEGTVHLCSRNGRHMRVHEFGECPWCRIERVTGTTVFGRSPPPLVASHLSRPSPMRMIVEGTLRRAKTGSGEAVEPRVKPIVTLPSGDVLKYAEKNAGGTIIAALAKARLGAGQALTDPFSKVYSRARDDLATALERWRRLAGAWRAATSMTLLADDLANFVRLEDWKKTAVAEARMRTTQKALDVELSRFSLGAAIIPGLGHARRARLAAAGIVSAADLSKPALVRVGALGDRAAVALLVWRDGIAARAARQLPAPAETLLIPEPAERDFRARIADAERSLLRNAGRLECLLDEVVSAARKGDNEVDAARRALAQALTDIDYLGLPHPSSTPQVRTHVTLRNKVKAKKAAATGCPRCGGTMIRRPMPPSGRTRLGCTSYPACRGTRPLPRAKP